MSLEGDQEAHHWNKRVESIWGIQDIYSLWAYLDENYDLGEHYTDMWNKLWNKFGQQKALVHVTTTSFDHLDKEGINRLTYKALRDATIADNTNWVNFKLALLLYAKDQLPKNILSDELLAGLLLCKPISTNF
eukprot:409277_1